MIELVPRIIVKKIVRANTYEARIASPMSKAPPSPADNPMTSLLLDSESPLKLSSALLMALLIPLATLSVPLAVVGGTYEAGVPLEAETDWAPVPNVFVDTLVSVVAGNVRSTPEGTIDMYVEVLVVWLVVCAEGGQTDRPVVLQTTLVSVYSVVAVPIVEDADEVVARSSNNRGGTVLFAFDAVLAVKLAPLDVVAEALIAQAEYKVV